MRAADIRENRSRAWDGAVCLFLCVVTLSVYAEVRHHEFVNFDDPQYVTLNRPVTAGLTWHGLLWAFTTTDCSNWHPLTWVSHMVDVQLWGLDAGAHHLTNALIHTLNSVLVFWVFKRLTAARWQSACVAALFALHPLHVESVAWVAERKDVLSAGFWMLTMWSYCRYVERPSWLRYGVTLLLLALGLMAKPMLVTLPLVLLLLDYWPLGRFTSASTDAGNPTQMHAPAALAQRSLQLVREKLPLLALAAASAAMTIVAQLHGGAVMDVELYPLPHRLANALVAYASYIARMLYPRGLAVFYPYRVPPNWQVAASAIAVAAVSVLAIRAALRRPYFLVGWLWYVLTLLPVIGLVQVGSQSMADRYTYLPLIGIFIIVAWGAPDLLERWRYRREALTVAAVGVMTVCILVTRTQLRTWRDTITLFEHALRVTTGNHVAHNNLGVAFAEQSQLDAALEQYRAALQIEPAYAEAHYNLATVLTRQGNTQAAIVEYAEALRLRPNFAAAFTDLGATLAEAGRLSEAVAQLTEAIRVRPEFARAHYNLGWVLARQGQLDDAAVQYIEAVRLDPDYAEAHSNLGLTLAIQGKADAAVPHIEAALRLRPDMAEAHYAMGIARAHQGQIAAAITHYRAALQLRPDWPQAANELAGILATTPDAGRSRQEGAAHP